MRFKTFEEVVAKYCLVVGLDEHTPLSGWSAALSGLLETKRQAVAAQRNPALKQKAEREKAELLEAVQLVAMLEVFAELTRCVQEDKQERFEWELKKPESQAALPGPDHPFYGQYLDIKEEARKKWPGVAFSVAKPAAVVSPPAPPTPVPAPRVPPPAVAQPATPEPAATPLTPPAKATWAPVAPPSQTQSLATILRRQLAALLDFDRTTAAYKTAWPKNRAQTSRALQTTGIRTFQDLLTHPDPPASALRVMKDLFKQIAGSAPDRRPDQEVALLLYLLAILAARVRLGVVITKLPDRELVEATRWALDLRWVDDKSRALLQSALEVLPGGRN